MTDQWNQPPADLTKPLKQAREAAKELGGQMNEQPKAEVRYTPGGAYPWEWQVLDSDGRKVAGETESTFDRACKEARSARDQAVTALDNDCVGKWIPVPEA